MIFKKIKNQKNSRSFVDEDVGYSVVRRYILYVRYRIQALEHRWKRTWHSILWNKNRSLQGTWVSELFDTYDTYVPFERTDAWPHEFVRAARTEFIETSLILNSSSWQILRSCPCRFWSWYLRSIDVLGNTQCLRIDLDEEDRFRR